MSIMRCDKHARHWDSDFLEECPLCESEDVTLIDALRRVRTELKGYADYTYCEGLRIAQTVPCLGWEEKVKDGTFGKTEYQAHRESNNLDGKHRGAWEAIRRVDAILNGEYSA